MNKSYVQLLIEYVPRHPEMAPVPDMFLDEELARDLESYVFGAKPDRSGEACGETDAGLHILLESPRYDCGHCSHACGPQRATGRSLGDRANTR